MVSIEGMQRNHRSLGFFLIIFLFGFSRIFAQTAALAPASTVPLAAEISRLETICRGTGASPPGGTAEERYNAFMDLARLYRLSGDPEAALKAYEGALTVSPGNGRVLFEQGRLFISLGEYERAATAINAMYGNAQNRELSRYLAAMLLAFGSGNTSTLSGLAADPEFSGFRSSIYYVLWKLSGLSLWKDRLVAELPQSPEAKIVSGTAELAATPLWFLFPGRNSVTLASIQQPLSSPPAQTPAVQTPAVQAPSPQVPTATAQPPEPSSQGYLQTGLFSREENANVLAERLKKAGFNSQIRTRIVNNNIYWAVYVPHGKDMNAEILKLKNAGFESFPVDKI